MKQKRRLAALIAAGPLMFPVVVQAQVPGPAAPAGQGVISYGPEFFADAHPTTALDMVQRLPGFVVEGGDNVRGFEGAAGNVLIDGRRPASKADNLEEILRRLPASQVERIDLIRGGAPGVDMQGRSMMANVIRSQASTMQGLVALANRQIYDGRNVTGFRIDGSGRSGDLSWETSLVGGQGPDDEAGEGLRTRVDRNGAPLIISDVDSEGLGTNAAWTGALERPLWSGLLRINGRLSTNGDEYDELNLARGAGPREVSQDVFDRLGSEIGASYSRPLSPRTSLELIGLRQTSNQTIESNFSTLVDRARFGLESDRVETIGRGVVRWRQTDALSWEVGGESAINTLESNTRFARNGANVVLPAANVEVEERRSEAFLKVAWRVTPRLNLDGALRYEASDITAEGDVQLEKSLAYAKPRLSLSWAQDPQTQLRFSVERNVGQLNFDDFVASSSLNTGVLTAGNPDLNPAQEWLFEAAFERRFWTNGAAVISLRHAEINDVVDRAPVRLASGSVFDAPANIGAGTRSELALNLTVPFDRFGLKGAQLRTEVQWRRSEVADPTTGETREISGLSPVVWETFFTQDLPNLKASWGIDAIGGWRETAYRFDEISTVKMGTYVTPFLEWRPRAAWVLRFEAPNITDRGVRRTRTVYAGPRDTAPVAFIEDRDLSFGRMIRMRVSRTFGG
ncbi:MAG: TonB-dependent receptor [Phenylobacterium sp.]|uniref:TonB-dependent receptor plug domain-containing protein n=1 Tax=Phenylobacterium sp. TaxID=1871053 RepID=UPI0025E3B07B|nr:TonB-dependent receptor [Phenylobacterium sp.]MCG9916997.1 TonB-dependent receptor [Phenylobacterium sp.]